MQINQLIKKHKRCIAILTLIRRKEDRIKDLEIKLSIEKNKPILEAFLIASNHWYLEEIEAAKTQINWLKLRHLNTAADIAELTLGVPNLDQLKLS